MESSNNDTSIGCSEWSLRALPIRDQFECLNPLGLSFFELGIGGDFPGHLPEAPSQDQIQEIQTLTESHQIRPDYCALECDLTHLDPTAVSRSLSRTLGQFQIAKDLGAHTINLTASSSPTIEVDETRWDRMVESITTLQTEAARLKLRIALKTRAVEEPQKDPGTFYIETLFTNRQALTKLTDTLPPQIGFAYEPAMFKAVNPSDLRLGLDILHSRIDHCHLQDWKPKNRTLEQAPIGQDDLNYPSLLSKLKLNTPLLITISPTRSPKPQLEQSIAQLRTWGQAA